jgi:hypothetical protein
MYLNYIDIGLTIACALLCRKSANLALNQRLQSIAVAKVRRFDASANLRENPYAVKM